MSGRGYLPIADIAAVYRISRRTAHRWAAQDRWRRLPGAWPPEYSLKDADESRASRRHDDGRQHRKPRIRSTL
jgi:hypothetical protein